MAEDTGDIQDAPCECPMALFEAAPHSLGTNVYSESQYIASGLKLYWCARNYIGLFYIVLEKSLGKDVHYPIFYSSTCVILHPYS